MKTKAVLAALAALAQESRLAIFRYLIERGPQGSTVGSIAAALDLPPATLSFHLKALTHAMLLVSRQEGRFIRYSASFATMNELIAYLTENCCGGRPELCRPACVPAKARARQSRRRITA